VFVCILPEKAVLEMTYAVSGGTLNPTHSLMVFKTRADIPRPLPQSQCTILPQLA